jgi:hypothetical protein
VISVLEAAVTSSQFVAGLRSGVVATLVGLAVGGVWKARTKTPAGLIGPLLVAASVVAMPPFRGVPLQLLVGIGALGLAGLTATLLRSPLLKALLAAPGAWLVTAASAVNGSEWVVWFTFLAIVAGSALLAESDRHLRAPPIAPWLLAVTLAGVYATLPDTEEILVVMGAAAPLIFLGWPFGWARLGSAGSFMTVGLVAWVSAWGGLGRPAAIIGAVASLGVLLLLPLATSALKVPLRSANLSTMFLIHLGVAGAASRVAGLRADPLEAALIATGVLAVGLGLIISVLRRTESEDAIGVAST